MVLGTCGPGYMEELRLATLRMARADVRLAAHDEEAEGVGGLVHPRAEVNGVPLVEQRAHLFACQGAEAGGMRRRAECEGGRMRRRAVGGRVGMGALSAATHAAALSVATESVGTKAARMPSGSHALRAR